MNTDPVVISSTVQEFQGARYYLCGHYFQRGKKRLHVAVWEAANGKVPRGHHVHHRDHIKHHNWLENLELLTRAEHFIHHGKTTSTVQRAARQRNARAAMEGNARLTKEERAVAAKQGWETATTSTVKCEVCGVDVQTFFPTRTRFCGGTCKARELRARRRLTRGDR